MASDSLIPNHNRSDSSNSCSDDFEFNCIYTNMPESPRLIQSPNFNLTQYATSEINSLSISKDNINRLNDVYIFDDPYLNSSENGHKPNYSRDSMNADSYQLNPKEINDSAMISNNHLINREINYLQSRSAPETPINHSTRIFKPSSIGYELQFSSLSDTEESIKDSIKRNYQHKSEQRNRDGQINRETGMKFCRRGRCCKMMKWDGLMNTRMLMNPKYMNKSKQSASPIKNKVINRDSLAMVRKPNQVASKEISRDEAGINKGSSSSTTTPSKCKGSCRTMRFLSRFIYNHRCSAAISPVG